jgi:inorganic phosphate transporter, PiT family
MNFWLIIFACTLLAVSNGANDNFKCVATLYGSKALSYRHALWLANLVTGLGALCAILLASKLMVNFSGKGIVPAEVANNWRFAVSVVFAAGGVVVLATIVGMPISTTHAIVGGLVGTGIMADPQGVNYSHLALVFGIPLICSPFVAVLMSIIIRKLIEYLPSILNAANASFVPSPAAIAASSGQNTKSIFNKMNLKSDLPSEAPMGNTSETLELEKGLCLKVLHISSACMVGFARGLNDAPKIASMMFIGGMTAFESVSHPLIAVSVFMVIGGILGARKVAQKMSLEITSMNASDGVSANVATAFVVFGASIIGVPVSTTHTTCGALFGVGISGHKANISTIFSIVAAWIITLPVAAALGATVYKIISVI